MTLDNYRADWPKKWIKETDAARCSVRASIAVDKFVKDCCEPATGLHTTLLEDIYKSYLTWATSCKIENRRSFDCFCSDLELMGYVPKRTRNGQVIGLRIVSNFDMVKKAGAAQAVLRMLEWSGRRGGGHRCCPVCHGVPEYASVKGFEIGHQPGCKLDRVIDKSCCYKEPK